MENTLKQDIKRISSQQHNLKAQRKTVHFIGERTVEPWKAISVHSNNRHQLRLLHATQQLLKGKTLKEIEPHNRESTTPLSDYKKSLDLLVEKYEKIAHSN